MSRPINISDSVAVNPSSFDDNNSSYASENTSYPKSNGYTDSNSSTYAQFNITTGSGAVTYIYYNFDCSSIPAGATINSVSCTAKAYINTTNSSRITTRQIQLCTGTTTKGSASTISNSTTAFTMTAGTWTRQELENAKIRMHVVRGTSNTTSTYYVRFYGATLTISYSLSGTEYEITSTLNADAVDSIDPTGSTWVAEGENYELNINADSTDDIIVKDNDNDVTDQLTLIHPTAGSFTPAIDVSSYDENESVYYKTYNDSNQNAVNGVYNEYEPTNGIAGSSSSTRVCVFSNTGSGVSSYLIYGFDTSSIPKTAIITSVTCVVKASFYTASYFNEHEAQLYSGTTPKGSSVTVTGTGSSGSTHTVDGGNSWTRADLDNIKIRYTVTRGTSNTTEAASFSFWGATLTVAYTVPADDYYVYTLTNVSTDHEIVIEDTYTGPKYLVTASSTYSGATITPNEKNVKEGGSITFTINVQNLYEIIITDNDADIKNSLVGSNGTYTYTITNVQTTHTIAISEQLSYSISASSTYPGATVSAPSKVYIGQNATITVNVDDFSVIKIFDDDTDITSLFTGSGTTYTYTFTNVQANHNILVIEKGKINVTCVSNVEGVTFNPNGVTAVNENASFTVSIDGTLTDDLVLTDNGIDVTNQISQQSTQTNSSIEKYPESQTNSGINSGQSYAEYAIGKSAEDPYSSTSNMYASSSSTGYVDYSFDFSDIPQNANISSITVNVYGHRESSTTDSTHVAKISLYSDSTLKSTEQEFTSTSNQLITIEDPGNWTRTELQSAKLRFTVGYYGGLVLGVTWIVEYSYIDTVTGYTISSITEPHDIILSKVFIPEEEDPELVYHSLTISSINATTTPERGTTRIVEGTNQTITIYPSDPLLTLATDNGVDITDSLVHHGQSIPDPVVSSVSGANYGFTLNNSTGYYVSQNAGQSNSAALCRVTFNLPVRCLITIQYINYAEGTYDYGIFGNIDTALATSNTADSNAFRVLSSSSDNSSSAQTLTYEIESGSHFIDIKYRKDTNTDSNNDNLQWKILSIEPLETNEYYEYIISNISDGHSLIFIFGDVTYYFITSTGINCKLFPDGSMVQLPGDNYKLTIVPDNINDEATATDNNSNVTDELQRVETEVTKDGKTITVVNYIYNISNVQATHDIAVTCQSVSTLYLKISGAFTEVRKAFIKVSGTWRTVDDPTTMFEQGKLYVHAT